MDPARAASILLAAGCLVRVGHYLGNRSLWLDEAKLALNVIGRGFESLFLPLDYDQGAPPLFLAAAKLCVLAAGPTEPALRFVPLAAGLLGLFLFYGLARQVSGRAAACCALALYAFSYPLVYYSQEFKQYGVDAAVTVGLLWLAARGLRSDTPLRGRGLAGLALLGAAAPWISHASLFTLAAVGTVLGVEWFRSDRTRISFACLGGTALAWIASLALLYLLTLRDLSENAILQTYWEKGFLRAETLGETMWKTMVIAGRFVEFAGFAVWVAPLAALLALAGARRMAADDRRLALLLALPFVFAAAASALGQYPLRNRLVLFLVPLLYVFTARGLDGLRGSRWRRWFIPCAVVLALGFAGGAARALLPIRREEVRPLMDHLAQQYLPGDVVCVFGAANPAVQYYRPRCALPEEAWNHVERKIGMPLQRQLVLERVPSSGRVWLLFAHVIDPDEEQIRHTLDGRLVEQLNRPGADLYLYVVPSHVSTH